MNCSRFRFLIQQKFDMDLAPQEERIVLGHLESCESCAKFHHQLQQVILAAEEVPLPDEMLPAKEEQLARLIMQQLPAAKASPFAFLDAIFTKFKNGKQAAPAPTGGSMFPHRTSSRELDNDQPLQSDSGKQQLRGARGKQQQQQQQDAEEHAGTNNRLKAMKSTFESDALYESAREAQSRTLGEKFGMAAPSNSNDDQPLTLAESIRRKISDSAKPPQQVDEVSEPAHEEEDNEAAPLVMPQAAGQESWKPGVPAAGLQSPIQAPVPPSGLGSFAPPPAAPGATQGPQTGGWGKTTPIDGGTWTPSQQSGTGGNTDWGGATAGNAAASFAPAQEKPKGTWGPSGWDNAGSTAATKSNEWGGSPQDGFDTAKVQVPAGWAQPQAPAPVQPIAANVQPASPMSAPAGQAPKPPSMPPAQTAQQPGGFAQSGPGWGVSPTSTTPAGGSSADPWGGSGATDDSWGGAASQKGWGTTDTAKPATGWGQTGSPATSWGQGSAPPAAAAMQAQGMQGQSMQGQGMQGQGMQGQSMPTIPSLPSVPPAIPPAMAQPPAQDWAGGAKQTGGWGTPTDANEWGSPAQAAPPAAVAPASPASHTAAHEAKPAWSLEAEQIETGTWRAFSPGVETLGAKPAAPPMKQADPLAGPKEDDRWSTPIQDRVKSAAPTNAGFAPPAMPAQAPYQAPAPVQAPAPAAKTATEEPPSHSKSGWNFPVYEPEESLSEPAWGTSAAAPAATQAPPAPPPARPTQPGQKPALPVDSIMDKLGTVLTDAAKTGPAPSSWDMSIQEKLQQKAQEPAGQFAPPEPVAPSAYGAATPADWSDEKAAAPFPPASTAPPQWGGFAQNDSMPASFVPGVEAPPPPPVQPAPPDKKSLFKLDDSAIDKLFNENLGVKDANMPPRPAAPAQAAPPTAWDQGGWAQGPAPAQSLAGEPVGATAWSAPETAAPPPTPAWTAPPAAAAANSPPAWSEPAAQSPAPQAVPAWAPPSPPATPAWSQPAPAAQPAPAWSPEPAAQPPAPAWETPSQAAPSTPAWESAPAPTAPPAAPTWAPAPQAAPAWAEKAAEPSAPPAPVAPSWTPDPTPQAQQAPTTWAPPTPPAAPAPDNAAWGNPAANNSWGGNADANSGAGDNNGPPKISGVTARGAGQGQPAASGAERRENDQFAAPAAETANKDKQGLFDLDDSAMDQLFRQNLGVEEAATSVTAPAPEPAPVISSMMPPPPPGWTPPPIPGRNQTQQNSAWPAPANAPQSGGWNQPPQPVPPAPVNQQPQTNAWPSAEQKLPEAAPHAPAQAAKGGLFAPIDDNVIDKIFADNLGVSGQQGDTMPRSNAPDNRGQVAPPPQPPAYAQPQPPMQPMPQPQPQPRAAAPLPPPQPSMPPPKIEGIGRLDSRADTSNDQGSGRIASIGKFLLDQKDLEKITKLTDSDLSDSSMRILTTEAAQELNTLLHHIGTIPSVIGSVIVGHDGLLIANTMPQDIEAESIGQWAMGIYMNTTDNILKMNQKKVHQIVGKTPRGYIVIADFGGGLLVTISDGQETNTLIPLLRSITQLVAQ